ncbi:porin [Variovorax sp. J2P1-59]|uniref:porin n=1 Tax=Variovorax flavidus TaxID=3053501 RepID=UPI002577E0AE|nr:porin [Variovorax sp. J2P1-59]MDM0073969.1 porin [Variovorax sp. J2P1-59]
MKKSLVALASLAVAGVASAQSSVTLFGVLDGAVSGYSNKAQERFTGQSTTASQTALSSSGETASRLGFRGTEDLGGGLAASFWLEASINTDNGTGVDNGALKFNRRSTISLSGPFGEVRAGRDYTPTYWNDTVFDPFGTNGVGSNLISTASKARWGSENYFNENYTRASNSIGYFLPPNLGGFYGQVMYVFNEKIKYDPAALTPNDPQFQRTGRYVGGRVGYATGPLDVALAYGESTIGASFNQGWTTTLNTWNLGASYDFGVVKLFGEYSDNRAKTDWSRSQFVDNVPTPGFRGGLIGASVPVGPGLIRASYSQVRYRNTVEEGFSAPRADKFALGYVHNLSKRTALYTTVARLNNKNGAGLTVGGPGFFTGVTGASLVPKTSTGYDIGMRHAF